MSQTATSNEGTTQAAKAATTGRAVLLLALFVVLAVALLNALDDPAADTTVVRAAAAPAPAAPVAATVPPPVTVPTRSPSEVKVLVANGVGVNGAASRVASRLQPIGYLLVTPGNTTTPSPVSGVAFTEGYQPEAQALATSLGLPTTAVQPFNPTLVADAQGANLVVVVGNDLAAAPPASTATPGQAAVGATGATGAATSPAGRAGTTTNTPVTSVPTN